jgi:hypothetical protein
MTLRLQIIIGSLLIAAATVLVWLPFFLQVPLPYITIDTWLYYNVLSVIEQRADRIIGYPQIGYPLFLKVSEMLQDRSWFAVFMQVAFQLFAVLCMFVSYALSFRKHVWLAALLFAGYMTSGMNLMYDSMLTPDSVLGSIYILCSAILLFVVMRRQPHWLALFSPLLVFGLAVRPSAAIMLLPFGLVLMHTWLGMGNSKAALTQLAFFALLCLGLSTVNYGVKAFSQFSIVTRPPVKPWRGKIKQLPLSHPLLQELASVVPHTEITDPARFDKIADRDSVFHIYMLKVLRGVTVRYGLFPDTTTMFIRNSEGILFKLDSLAREAGSDSLAYAGLKERFIASFADSAVVFRAERGLRYVSINLPRFFTIFQATELTSFSFRLDDFYGSMLHERWTAHHVHDDWRSYGRKDHRLLVIDQVYRRTVKELHEGAVMSAEAAESDLRSRLGESPLAGAISTYHRTVHHWFFRNAAYPVILLLMVVVSGVLMLFTRFKEPVPLIVLALLSVVISTAFVHFVVFKLFTWRYTYQITFFYYLAVILVPVLWSFMRVNGNKDE